MKYQHPFLLLICMALFGSMSAQQVVSTSGNHHENSNLMISYSLGEAVIFTGSSSENTITQGFHQSNLTVLGVATALALDIKVYPNPTMGSVFVDLTGEHGQLKLTLYDGAGRIIEDRSVSRDQKRVEFDLSPHAAGNYILQVYDATDSRNSYQIIKTH